RLPSRGRAPLLSVGAGSAVAPVAAVAAPKPIAPGSIEVPCWSCHESESWPLAFRTDLDLLAPLGSGTGNAAAFFSQFAEPDGKRNAEYEAAGARKIDGPPGIDKVLPPDDPFLLEAEPWCDQATMRFYPDFFPLDGWETRIPNLILPLTLAKSWTARGLAATERDVAMADFRRTIRLGRLLRQEGNTMIADLIGLAVIRIGTKGVFEHAQLVGDSATAIVASVVLGEIAPQRLLASERMTRADVTPYLRRSPEGAVTLELPDWRLDDVVEMAKSESEPRFRGEAILALHLVRFLGRPEQRATVGSELETLARSKDPRAAGLARWSLEHEPAAELLERFVRGPGRGNR
ncbi:MAG: hypothetical protein ACREQY_09585, partial [Candidatus Binatia bacterium]